MINIISKSVLEKRTRGPKKVVENLIAGLDKIGYPYVTNRSLDSTKRVWIHDDTLALKKIGSLPKDIAVIIGPNLYVQPEEFPPELELSSTVFVFPSEEVKNIWMKKGYDRSKSVIWPAGVNIEEFQPSELTKEFVLVYFKNRKEEELREIITSLTNLNIRYRLLRYGNYKEDEYRMALSKSRYMIWLGGSESQGLALEEAFSAGVPTLVIDEGKKEYGVALTAAPYFGEDCGRKIANLEDFPAALKEMEANWQSFRPREFVLENLDLKKQARAFVDIFDTHFDLSFENGLQETLRNNKSWRNNRFYFKLWVMIKEAIKNISHRL